MSISLNDLINKTIYVHIQYFDTDRSTVLHENNFNGLVVAVDATEGITIKANDDGNAITAIPPSLDACSREGEEIYHAHWSVFRTQAQRSDGEHEWWEWEPKSN
ncbi:MAG: hypothetical protein JKY01_10365 [Pseudomonadales bacterium]|nr:hypothetical protein [Pseudomonadales bacterium]